jgi:hypothetical protein
MQYSKAFQELGYRLDSPRQDWTAEKDDGVCVTLWKRRIDWNELSYDTRLHKTSIDVWSTKSGNSKRIRHARRAIDEFGGWVDAILISGEPGNGYEDAQIWVPAEKSGKRWRVTFLDEEVGHIRIEVQSA